MVIAAVTIYSLPGYIFFIQPRKVSAKSALNLHDFKYDRYNYFIYSSHNVVGHNLTLKALNYFV